MSHKQQHQQNRNQVNEENHHQEGHEHSSYLHTEVKVPLNLPSPILMSSSAGMAQGLIGEGFHVDVSRISGASQDSIIVESPQQAAELQRDYEEKVKEQELLAAEFEKELERRTVAYRKQQEAETELIRKQLEKQHLKDVEFRKELVEVAIDNQKKQMDLEVRFAKRQLDRQRLIARESLERSKFHQDIQVNIDTAAGHTTSGATTHAESEKEQHSVKQN